MCSPCRARRQRNCCRSPAGENAPGITANLKRSVAPTFREVKYENDLVRMLDDGWAWPLVRNPQSPTAIATLSVYSKMRARALLSSAPATATRYSQRSAKAASLSAARMARAVSIEQGQYVGDTAMTQLSIGFQAGGQAYSEVIFFQDERAFTEFTSGNFEFSGDVSAVAITAGASASAGTGGTSAGASGGKKDATTAGAYKRGWRFSPLRRAASCMRRPFPGRNSHTRRSERRQ